MKIQTTKNGIEIIDSGGRQVKIKGNKIKMEIMQVKNIDGNLMIHGNDVFECSFHFANMDEINIKNCKNKNDK